MNDTIEISSTEIDRRYDKLKAETEAGGYYLNADVAFTKELIKGLMVNEERYGYGACPCRLASGKKADDIDIICPCDYRDPDLGEYDCCYCALYVSQVAMRRERTVGAIPERRPPPEIRRKTKEKLATPKAISQLSLPVWRCKVCGYLCARDEPPEICPICKAKKERFERFI
jgi:ferredoxin-thioredoxin reductase catalytic subunit